MTANFQSPYDEYAARIEGEAPDPEYGAKHPHCDGDILHAPGECEYCDLHPDRQRWRQELRIAFTGHDPLGGPDDGEVRCPAEVRRSRATINAWGGNVKRPAKLESREDLRQTETQLEKEGPAPVEKCGTRRSPDWYCSRDLGHDGPCAAWPVSHRAMNTMPKEAQDAVALDTVPRAGVDLRGTGLRATGLNVANRCPWPAGGVSPRRAGGRGPGAGALLWAALVRLERPGRRLCFVFSCILAAETLIFGWSIANLGFSAGCAVFMTAGYYLSGGRDA